MPMDESDFENNVTAVTVAQAKPIVETPVTPHIIPPVKQRINNIQQKEEAMHYLGLNRNKYMIVIVDALEAVTIEKRRDPEGNIYDHIVPDLEKRKWGSEQTAKLFGDYIQHVDANVRVTHSVEELLNVFEKAKLK